MIKKNQTVQIYKILLPSNERAENLPLDTKEVPFEMRVKGKLIKAANIGDKVDVITASGRKETGILIEDKPFYTHSFGHYVEAIEEIKDVILNESEGL
ncbi:MAG: 2-amino-4-ketopentanoate thiolase [Tenericutes bacterium HGW-Tenericutes-3]|nr:MAG: 2-amino-4-ketopentanoate thiolase [Tenericutes bacterium HGW-Tenericutes-3]